MSDASDTPRWRRDFPIDPMPVMLLPLVREELREYRDTLAERLRRLAVAE